MYQFQDQTDTIAAISTATGQGGIGIIRISGDKAITIAKDIFKPANAKTQWDPFTVHYGWVVKDDTPLDEVLLTVMKAPRSYTKEDIIEINCHGGLVSLKTILEYVIEKGARLAEPGEFTKRAFLNGRIDLAQAEAVLDIIQSKTSAFLQVSTHQLHGDLSKQLAVIREELMAVYIEMEAVLNFPEDDIDAKGRQSLVEKIDTAKEKVLALLSSSEHGRILKDGMKIVLCGRPNVGKSSLLNALLKTSRAIVSDVAGTTRDTIEETSQINGVPFQLIDTAGILAPRDAIEEEAVKRSRSHIESADINLLILDSSDELVEQDYELLKYLKEKNVLVVLNKSDLPVKLNKNILNEYLTSEDCLNVSALKRDGIEALEQEVFNRVWQSPTVDTHAPLISNMRHITALKDCLNVLSNAQKGLTDQLSLEFVSDDVKIGVNYLDAITGRNIDNDLLENIFSQFCIGK